MLGERLDVADLVRQFPQLRLLVLHGSRARGSGHAGSDWDFGYVADPGLDELGLRMKLSLSLETDRIDLVDLERASSVLRYRAAGEGKPAFERHAGDFERFATKAILFWLDVEPVLSKAHAELLERLG